jgi:regulator of protease activity HflC (stomatin/prohibitin superfamily)
MLPIHPYLLFFNFTMQVLYVKVIDAYKASYGVENALYAVTQLAQTTMRSELGKITLDVVFAERDSINRGIVESIQPAAAAWGLEVLRYEVRVQNLALEVCNEFSELGLGTEAPY